MTEKQICKRLGVTPSGLHVIAKAVAHPEEHAGGEGFGPGAAAARRKLLKDGLVTGGWSDIDQTWSPWVITQAGRNLVAEARNLGW